MLTFSEKIACFLRPAELGVAWKILARVRRREAISRGARFWVDPASNFGSRLLVEGDYEPTFTDRLLGLLAPGAVFCDLGANEGVFSVWASRYVGPSGRVLAIEPQARLWPVILRNLQINDCANVTLLPFAVGEERSEIEMSLFPSTNTGSSSLVDSARSRFARRQPVTVLPTHRLLDEQTLTKVDVLKIDIEGYELFALKGLGRWLNPQYIRHLLIELHPAQLRALGHSVEQIHALLTDAGYRRAHAGAEEHWTAPV